MQARAERTARAKVVALREVDANLQEIGAEFQALVAELLVLVRFGHAMGSEARSVQVGVGARRGAICSPLRVAGLQRIGAGTGGDGHGDAANVSGRSAGADPRGRAGRRAAGHPSQVSSTDAAGVRWQASAVYRADAAGDIDLNSAAAASGSYSGVSGMGLIWSMQPTRTPPLGAYSWGSAPRTFAVSVNAGGARVAAGEFQRTMLQAHLTRQDESVSADGFMGQYWHAGTATTRRPAVLVPDGLPGGMPAGAAGHAGRQRVPRPRGRLLQGAGPAANAVGYPAGVLRQGADLARAAARVEPSAIAVLGISRGSEAAQLLGVYYPSLVHAVIGSVPSSTANCSYPSCAGPAWTLHGKPLPYTHDYDDPAAPDDPAAVIPDQRINGPVFLDCGEDDQAWTSCPYGQAIVTLLDNHHDQRSHVLYPYPKAGHGVGSLVPYETVPGGPRSPRRALSPSRPTRRPMRSCGLACSASSAAS